MPIQYQQKGIAITIDAFVHIVQKMVESYHYVYESTPQQRT